MLLDTDYELSSNTLRCSSNWSKPVLLFVQGFGRRRRRALRELLKQTVEFIVPYQYQYQNQYSCSPPPLFMLCISLLQVMPDYIILEKPEKKF
jgi:hypothetical protein